MYEHSSLKDSDKNVENCIKLLTNNKRFYEAMEKVGREWKCSAETNLTHTNNNRRAWLGRAACCYILRQPENITQEAWIKMSPNQRLDANKMADKYLNYWDNNNEGQMILFGDNYA